MHSLPLIISYLTNAADKFLAVNLDRKWLCPIQVLHWQTFNETSKNDENFSQKIGAPIV
jgi:hypothetical protein